MSNQTNPNAFDADKYKWKGFKPRFEKGWAFRWKPWLIPGANFRELHFLWWKVTVSWWWNHQVIWNDGWDAHFRQTMDESIRKDQVIESTYVRNRVN